MTLFDFVCRHRRKSLRSKIDRIVANEGPGAAQVAGGLLFVHNVREDSPPAFHQSYKRDTANFFPGWAVIEVGLESGTYGRNVGLVPIVHSASHFDDCGNNTFYYGCKL